MDGNNNGSIAVQATDIIAGLNMQIAQLSKMHAEAHALAMTLQRELTALKAAK